MANEWAAKWSGWTPVFLRVVIGVVFAYSGWMKFQDMAGTIGFFGQAGIPAATFFAYLVAIIELVGGIALIAGLWTRVAAKLTGIVMLVATLLSFKMGFQAATLPLVMLAACFTVFTLGGGRYSMDK